MECKTEMINYWSQRNKGTKRSKYIPLSLCALAAKTFLVSAQAFCCEQTNKAAFKTLSALSSPLFAMLL